MELSLRTALFEKGDGIMNVTLKDVNSSEGNICLPPCRNMTHFKKMCQAVKDNIEANIYRDGLDLDIPDFIKKGCAIAFHPNVLDENDLPVAVFVGKTEKHTVRFMKTMIALIKIHTTENHITLKENNS